MEEKVLGNVRTFPINSMEVSVFKKDGNQIKDYACITGDSSFRDLKNILVKKFGEGILHAKPKESPNSKTLKNSFSNELLMSMKISEIDLVRDYGIEYVLVELVNVTIEDVSRKLGSVSRMCVVGSLFRSVLMDYIENNKTEGTFSKGMDEKIDKETVVLFTPSNFNPSESTSEDDFDMSSY